MLTHPFMRRGGLLAWVSALVAVAAIAVAAPAQAVEEPVTITFTQVGDWYESGGGAGNQYRVDVLDAKGTPTPTAVRVLINNSAQAPSEMSGRIAEVKGSVRAGENTVAVNYLGDGGFDAPEFTTTVTALPATTPSTVTFQAPSTIAHATALPLSIVVKAGSTPPDGEVRVTVDGGFAGSARLVNGRASVTVPGPLDPGARQIAVTYGGWRGIAASSAAPATVTVGPATLPAVSEPSIRGDAVEGATLEATVRDLWSHPADQITYQWLANGAPIGGATAQTLVVPSSVVGKRLTVAVRGRRAGFLDSTLTSAPTMAVRSAGSQVAMRAHVQNIGWQPWQSGNGVIGTTGRALRIEALQLKLVDPLYLGDITTYAHVQNLGWTDYALNGATAGTTGRGLRVEAVALSLSGEMGQRYDLWYRAHIQNYGWLAWTSNGSPAGSEGESLRVEALEVRVLPKGSAAPSQSGNRKSFIVRENDLSSFILAQGHVQNIGWQAPVPGGTVIGTTGRGLRLEAVNLNYGGGGSLTAQAHVQNRGWLAPVQVSHHGGIVGTEGQGLRMEAIRLSLPSSSQYTVYYRTHVQNIGWTGWASNGQPSGSAGFAYRMEAMDVRIVPKGKPGPASKGVPAFFQR